jgi:hypothetical protein
LSRVNDDALPSTSTAEVCAQVDVDLDAARTAAHGPVPPPGQLPPLPAVRSTAVTSDAGTRAPKGLLHVPKVAAVSTEPNPLDTYVPRFPSAWPMEWAQASLWDASEDQGWWQDGTEGPRWRITISPGSIRISSTDPARAERLHERNEKRRRMGVDLMAASSAADDAHSAGNALWGVGLIDRDSVPIAGADLDREPVREVTEWSRKSRANMVRRLCTLDYESWLLPRDASGEIVERRVPAMLTLTYPGDWLTVAPNGKAVKRHKDLFRKRYERRWGEPLTGIWKLEFQGRGAPHMHMLMCPPTRLTRRGQEGIGRFLAWVSETWADVVQHPDPVHYARHLLAGTGLDWNEGLRATDPKRIAVYFTKHGSFAGKEYQNLVPEQWREPGKGPGRFWGVMGLEVAERPVVVSADQAIAAARWLRRWQASQKAMHRVTVDRVRRSTGEVYTRTVSRRLARMPRTRGFVSVNDGPAVALLLAKVIDTSPSGAARSVRNLP